MREVKIALQKSFDSKRNALGAQLLGLIAGLFTLLQTVQNSGKQPLSGIFPNLAVINIPYTPLELLLIEFLKLGLFTTAVFILLFLITRTIFRFSFYSKYSDIVYWVERNYLKLLPERLEWLKDRDLLIQVREIAGLMIAGKMKRVSKREKFLKKIPHDWFISGVTWNDEEWGYVFCLGLSMVFTVILVFLLW